MLDHYSHMTGGAFVRVPSSPRVFHARGIAGEWNGFPVPVFTHGEAWHILTVLGYEFGDDVNGNIWYTDTVTGEVCHLSGSVAGDAYTFAGWMWEVVPVPSRETVDALTSFIESLFDMDLVTGMCVETIEAWLALPVASYANESARLILATYGYLVDENEDLFTDATRILAVLNGASA